MSAGMSPVTWGRVEGERPVRGLTYSAVERALGWRDGEIGRIGAGEVQATRPARRQVAPGVWAVDRPVRDVISDIDESGLSAEDRQRLVDQVLAAEDELRRVIRRVGVELERARRPREDAG